MSAINGFKKCKIKPGIAFDLAAFNPDETFGWNKDSARAQTAKNLARITDLQETLYAEQKRSLLIVLQATDTGGKDGTVETIGGAMNPTGVRVISFKKPTKEELEHDFLWRIEKQTPKKPGEVVIFNRSHYEDVGIVRVRGLVPELVSEDDWRKRYDIINDFERATATPNEAIPGGVTILKFFLRISPDEQLERLKARMNDPKKHWKVSEADFLERPLWHEYTQAFSEAITRCSTDIAPWYVIPANNKWMRDLIISQIVVDTMEAMNLQFPEPAVDIATIRQRYFNKDGGLKTEYDVPTLKTS